MFYLTMHSTHLRLYGVRHMVKDHSDSESENPLPPHGLLSPMNIPKVMIESMIVLVNEFHYLF